MDLLTFVATLAGVIIFGVLLVSVYINWYDDLGYHRTMDRVMAAARKEIDDRNAAAEQCCTEGGDMKRVCVVEVDGVLYRTPHEAKKKSIEARWAAEVRKKEQSGGWIGYNMSASSIFAYPELVAFLKENLPEYPE